MSVVHEGFQRWSPVYGPRGRTGQSTLPCDDSLVPSDLFVLPPDVSDT